MFDAGLVFLLACCALGCDFVVTGAGVLWHRGMSFLGLVDFLIWAVWGVCFLGFGGRGFPDAGGFGWVARMFVVGFDVSCFAVFLVGLV